MVSQDYLNGLAVALLGWSNPDEIVDPSRMVSFATKRHACATCSVTPWNGIQDSRPPMPSPAERLAKKVSDHRLRIKSGPQLDSYGNIKIPKDHIPFYYGGAPSGGSISV